MNKPDLISATSQLKTKQKSQHQYTLKKAISPVQKCTIGYNFGESRIMITADAELSARWNLDKTFHF